MQGKVIEFSLRSGLGKIESNKKVYLFSFSHWMSATVPEMGLMVDFELNHRGQATMITTLLRDWWMIDMSA